MCGIGGLIGPLGRESETLAIALRDRMAHRGPDGHGCWCSPQGDAALVHRRLAIIDTSDRASQPMRTPDGRFTLTYNGEIYNHREVRAELETLGARFRTTSDTEVVLEGWARWGEQALPRLRGMFAFAIHDAELGTTTLVRDPLGIKPLYLTAPSTVSGAGGVVAFASEVRPLARLVSATADPEAIIDLLLWGNIAAPRTVWSGVRSLPAGHLARIESGRVEIRRWNAPTDWSAGAIDPAGPENLVEGVRDSVRAHLVADVPIAVFLSSGVDSAVVASVAAASDAAVHALTVRDPTSDEADGAARVARRLGIMHTVLELSGEDTLSAARTAPYALDQPTLDGMNTFLISRAAGTAGFKVALSGVGGDELFGGYRDPRHFARLSAVGRALAPVAARTLRRSSGDGAVWSRITTRGRARWIVTHTAGAHGPYLVTRGVFAPKEVALLTGASLGQVMRVADERLSSIAIAASHPNYASAADADQYLTHQLLRDTDAAAMAHSLEVRTPLVDARLMAAAAACDPRNRLAKPQKRLLRSAAMHPLDDLITGPKRGFRVPMVRWIRSGDLELSDGAGALLDGASVTARLRGTLEGREHWSRAWLLHTLATHLERP